MAVFGPQLIYTVIMFVLLSKMGKFHSFGRFLLCNKLFRYLSPSSDLLKKAVRNHYKNTNSKNKKLNRLFEIDDDKEEFNIPEGATVELAMSPVKPNDFYYIKYADDFQSYVDISIIALLIYATTEIYVAYFTPSEEVNLSVVWCGMALLYGFATLSSIAVNYLRTEEGALLYVFAGLSFFFSLVIQLADTKYLDFNLKEAFRNVSTSIFSLIQAHIDSSLGNSTSLPSSTSSTSASGKHSTTTQKIYSQLKTYSTNELLFSCLIAVVSGFIGALLFFPSFRLARLHFLCLKYSNESKFKRFFYYFNFLFPLFISFCWIKFNVTNVNSGKTGNETNSTNDSTSETVKQFLTIITAAPIEEDANQTKNFTVYFKELRVNSSKFVYNILMANNLKVYLIVIFFMMRLALYKHYAQAYLNLAFETASNLRKRSARITNLKYISTISSIYQYYGVVASQYVMPLFVLLFFGLLLKTLGDLSWCGNSDTCNKFVDSISNYTRSFRLNSTRTSPSFLKQLETSNFNVTMNHNILNKIFSPFVLRSLIGYFTFWTATIWFIISCFGLLYYQYIDRQAIME